jgi:tetratricopeptide (TPR) repeat protein
MNDTIRNIHSKAVALYKQKRFQDAIALWKKALEVDPEEVEVLYSLGLINFEMKQYEEAVRFLERLLELSPGHFKAMIVLGTSYMKLRRFDLAEEYIQKALALNPKHKLALLHLAAIYGVKRHFEESIKTFQKVVELYPDEPRGYLGIAKLNILMGEREKAKEHLQKVLELDPSGPFGQYAKKALFSSIEMPQQPADGDEGTSANRLYAQGMGAYLEGKHLLASRYFGEYARRTNTDIAHFLHAESLIRCGRLREAFLALKRAILKNPRKGLYYKELALVLDRIGKPEDVLEILKKAKNLGKADDVVLYLEGKNLNRTERYTEAKEALRQAIRKNRNNLAARYELAKALIQLSEKERAQEELNRINESPLESPIKKKSEKMLLAL